MENRIIEKATELYFRYGIKSVTMDDIASGLGVSKKTIYQYYKDKDSLVDAVVEREINRGVNDCRAFLINSENAIHESFLEMDTMQEMLSAMNPSIIFDLQKYHPNSYKKFNEHKNLFIYQMIRQNIERGQQEGLYREDINADILTRFRIESIFMAFNPEIYAHGKYSIAAIEIEIFENFQFGICTTKGQKLISKYKNQRKTNSNL